MLCLRCFSFGTGRTSQCCFKLLSLVGIWANRSPSRSHGAPSAAPPGTHGRRGMALVRQVLGRKMLPCSVAKICLSLMNSMSNPSTHTSHPARLSAGFRECRQARLWSHSYIFVCERTSISLFLMNRYWNSSSSPRLSRERESRPCKTNGDYRKVCWREPENRKMAHPIGAIYWTLYWPIDLQ